MAAVAPMIDTTTFDFDQLTNDIFSILENKFLFNGIDSAGKNEIPVGKLTEELKANENDIGKVRILSIDGLGSTEGILAAKSLSHLEASLRKKSGNSDARIADFFDVAAGSGVGGILIALLFTKGKDGRPMFKADEALQFLVNNRRKLNSSSSSSPGVFSRLFRQSSKTEKLFRRIFGESTLKDTLKPVLIPCYDLSTRAPFLFSRADALETDGYDFKMREVCVATSADPTTVGAVEMKSVDRRTRILAVDGGLAMNNPTAAAITHVLNNKQEFPFCDSVEDLLVVSLGNGESDPSGKNLTFPSSNGFLKIAGEGASETVDQAISMAFGEFRTTNYVRIQANGFDVGRTPMNNSSSSSTAMEGKKVLEVAEKMLKQKNVESVLFRGKKIIEKTNLERLDCFGGELIKEHERRKSSVFPTVMFKQASPRSSSATSSSSSSC